MDQDRQVVVDTLTGYGGSDVAVDDVGHLYVVNYYDQRIRKVAPDGVWGMKLAT